MRRGPEKTLPPESWLPPGWVVEGKVRQSGVLAGRTDKYYIEPNSGQRFSSKVGVLNFLKTGILPMKKKAVDNAGAIKDSGGSSAGKKHMKSSSTKPKTFKFDFSNVPEKMEWVSTDTYMDRWTPFTGDDKKVADSMVQEWDAAFSYLVVGSGYPMF